MWRRKVVIPLTLGLASLGAIGAMAMVRGPMVTFEHILLADWTGQLAFDPVVLYPEPDDVPLRGGPSHSETLRYVEMVHIDARTHSTATHSIFQSDSFSHRILGGRNPLLKQYKADREDVVTHTQTLRLDNRTVEVEVRRNQGRPNDGVTLFVLGGTHVAHHWKSSTEEQALALLEQHARLVTEDDQALIQEFDQRLRQKLQE